MPTPPLGPGGTGTEEERGGVTAGEVAAEEETEGAEGTGESGAEADGTAGVVPVAVCAAAVVPIEVPGASARYAALPAEVRGASARYAEVRGASARCAVVPAEVRGASAPWARSAPYPRGVPNRAHAQANTQVSAGPRARARDLRSAGVTG
ncbi:hypothetical protein [Streptomyces zaomyceticus]|uniref:hypothetical protein n=1 Tax=Streptomyces zaomyceticus TaxID=68286 RepID=UPI0037B627C1